MDAIEFASDSRTPRARLALVWDADRGVFQADQHLIDAAPVPPRVLARRSPWARRAPGPLVRLRNLLTPAGWSRLAGVAIGVLILAGFILRSRS